MLLELCEENICGLPITPEQVQAAFSTRGFESQSLVTADDPVPELETAVRSSERGLVSLIQCTGA